MLRKILAVFIGVIIGSVIVFLIQRINTFLYPMPVDLDTRDMEALKEFISDLPAKAFLMVIISHAFGALVAGFTAARIAPNMKPAIGLITIFIMLVATISSFFMIPQPTWMIFADIIGVLLLGYIGVKLGSA